MELGITPIITSGMIIQLLTGAQLIDVDMSVAEDRVLYGAAQKRTSSLVESSGLSREDSPPRA